MMLLPVVVAGDSSVDGGGRPSVPRTCFLIVGVGGVTIDEGESKRESCSKLSSGGRNGLLRGFAKSRGRGIREVGSSRCVFYTI